MPDPSEYSEELYAALSKLRKQDLLSICVYLGAAASGACADLEGGVHRAAEEAVALRTNGIIEHEIPAVLRRVRERGVGDV